MSDVIDRDHGYKRILRAIFGMEKETTLTVGIHEGLEGEGGEELPTERKRYGKSKGPAGRDSKGRFAKGEESSEEIDPDSIAAYAAANEYGTDTIPARPWMRTAIDGNQAKYRKRLGNAMKRVIEKGISPAVALVDVGRAVRNDLVRSIKSGGWVENKEATKARKGSSKPLVDTGAMQRAITFKVVKK